MIVDMQKYVCVHAHLCSSYLYNNFTCAYLTTPVCTSKISLKTVILLAVGQAGVQPRVHHLNRPGVGVVFECSIDIIL